MEAGDLMTADKDFRAVLTREPNNVGAHGNLAVVYMRRKEWKPALPRRAGRRAPGAHHARHPVEYWARVLQASRL